MAQHPWSAGGYSGYDSICECTAAAQMMLADEAAGALGWAGTVVPALEYAGALIDVVARINEPELKRRSRPDPVVDRALLRTLMELPSGIEIPLDALSTEHLVTLQIDGDGLVEWTGHGVRRTYEPACDGGGCPGDRPASATGGRRRLGVLRLFAPGGLRHAPAMRSSPGPRCDLRGGLGGYGRAGPDRRGRTRAPGHPTHPFTVAVLRAGLRAVEQRPQ